MCLMAERLSIYGGKDPRFRPAYAVPEASRVLRIPPATVAWWSFGRDHYHPVIDVADRRGRRLSFVNLVELGTLHVITQTHGVRLQQVRDALHTHRVFFERDSKNPLAFVKFLTNNRDLFVEKMGEYLNLSQGGQLTIRELIASSLARVEFEMDEPMRFFPLIPTRGDSRAVIVDPKVIFGRPAIAHTRVATSAVASRVRAGEEVESVANDLGLDADLVTQAVLFEETLATAA